MWALRLCLVFLLAGCGHLAGVAVGAATAQGSLTIPLCAGLTIVGAVNEPRGDYEPILRIESVDDRAVHAKYSTSTVVGGVVRHVTVSRTIFKGDLARSGMLVNWFTAQAPVTIPGSTAFGTSAAVLAALKTKGVAALALVDRGASAIPADRNVHPNIYDYRATYELHRLDRTPATVPVTVNGTKMELPVITARGTHQGDTAEFHFLDDERNPISLRIQFTSFGSAAPDTVSQTVKIAYRCSQSPSSTPAHATALEKALLETGRVDVYDIYFDFNSDRIREESAPTLKEIADVLRRHPDWNLPIEGHTDNIGSGAANLDLSQRRAGSVKAALVTSFSIGADRLTTSVYGEARPRDRNDTLDGRARNRRVELVRSPARSPSP